MKRQLMVNRGVRKIVFWLHPKIHPDAPSPTTFKMSGGCVLCRFQTWLLPADHKQSLRDALADQSSIVAQEETSTSRKVVMSATVRRQLEALSEDPEKKAAIEAAIQELARK